jgi:hypothetical protein
MNTCNECRFYRHPGPGETLGYCYCVLPSKKKGQFVDHPRGRKPSDVCPYIQPGRPDIEAERTMLWGE